MGWGSGHTPFRLLGPPEVLRSTFTVNSYPDDTQDPIRDRLNNRTDVGLFNMTLSDYTQYRIREPYEHFGLPELGSCLFFYRSFIYKQRIYTLPREKKSPAVLQYFLELSWRRCAQTTLELIFLLRSTSPFSKQSREDFCTAATWLHRYHPETLVYNVGAFAKFGSLKDLLEILYRIVNGPQVRYNQIMERNRVRKEAQKRLMAMRRDLLHVLTLKKMNSKEIQIRTREQEKRRKSKEMQKRSDTHLRDEKRIMMAKKAIERFNYDPKYRFLYNKISYLFAELLKADLEYLISGQLSKISSASKWCPSLDSSYDRSTLFCESIARRIFPYDSCPEYRELDECHYADRVRNRLQKEVLVPLRRNFLKSNKTLMESNICREDYLNRLVVRD
jgi:hypothetical protein